MSEENVEIVRRGWEAWESGDLTGLLALMANDFVMRRRAPLPDAGEWPGREGFLNLAAEWGENFDEWSLKPEEVAAAGENHVIVRVRQGGRGVASGAEVSGTYWYLIEMRDGKGISIEICASREQAVEAAGLSE